MAVNRFKPHVWVVPEDDATRQLANGFLRHPALDGTCIGVYPPSRGWARVLSDFEANHLAGLRNNQCRHLVLLIDFDGQVDWRTKHFQDRFPGDVSNRVYLLGVRDEPEPLRKAVGLTFEQIGDALAKACVDGSPGLWGHEMLRHNDVELSRLVAGVKCFLFRPGEAYGHPT